MEKEKQITEICREIYITKGFSAVFDHVNKILESDNPIKSDIAYEYCKACNTSTPAWQHTCLICEQPTEPIPEIEDRENKNSPASSTKKLWLCPCCGSDNVKMKVWVNANTKVVMVDDPADGYGDVEGCCNDCGEQSLLVEAKLISNTKIEGFQVVDDVTGNIHPDMDGSFCLYNLSQVRKMLNNKKREGHWELLAVWTGDVEEPTIMFDGDPRD